MIAIELQKLRGKNRQSNLFVPKSRRVHEPPDFWRIQTYRLRQLGTVAVEAIDFAPNCNNIQYAQNDGRTWGADLNIRN